MDVVSRQLSRSINLWLPYFRKIYWTPGLIQIFRTLIMSLIFGTLLGLHFVHLLLLVIKPAVLLSSGTNLSGGHLRYDKSQSMRLRLRAALRDPPDTFAPEDESIAGLRRVLLCSRRWGSLKKEECFWIIGLYIYLYIFIYYKRGQFPFNFFIHPSWICLCPSQIFKNFATFPKDTVAISTLQFCPAFWSRVTNRTHN